MCNDCNKTLSVKNGKFVVSKYNVSSNNIKDRAGSKNFHCSIKVEFIPSDDMTKRMTEGDRICLVQAVSDKIELKTVNDGVIQQTSGKDSICQFEKNKKAGFSERLTGQNWAIDQQIYDENQQLCNLDPRYVEQRLLTDSNYRDHSDFSKKDIIGYAQNYILGDAQLCSAILSDEPNAIYSWGGKVPVGYQEFEVVAMLDKQDGGKEYLASLSWGWKIESTEKLINKEYTPKLSTTEIFVSDQPSGNFIEAAKAWNAMVRIKHKEMTLETERIGILPES